MRVFVVLSSLLLQLGQCPWEVMSFGFGENDRSKSSDRHDACAYPCDRLEEPIGLSVWGKMKQQITKLNTSSRSPCFHSTADSVFETEYFCLPGLMLTGMPKCGTTDLFRRVAEHTSVVRTKHKEPHWLTRRIRASGFCFETYLRLFNANKTRDINGLTFEGSAGTFWDRGFLTHEKNSKRWYEAQDHTIPAALSFLLGVNGKYMVMFCDPARRTLSDFMVWGVKRLKKTTPDYVVQASDFEKHVNHSYAWFVYCTREHTVTECAYLEPVMRPRPWISLGLYHVFLKQWRKHIPESQLMVINSEEYYTNPKTILSNVFAFAGLAEPSKGMWDAILSLSPANVHSVTDDSTKLRTAPETANALRLLNTFYSDYKSKF
eukprot:m.164024 g.164024  ORF g.164024 m.164024 type:complete len:376 (-) comp31318_c0_seq1:40-1167(-)